MPSRQSVVIMKHKHENRGEERKKERKKKQTRRRRGESESEFVPELFGDEISVGGAKKREGMHG